MKRSYVNIPVFLTIFLLGLILLNSGCKSEFERLRASGDTEKIYKTANELYEDGHYLKAQTLYELVMNNYRGKSETEDIYFKYAYTHYYLYEYIMASYYFQRFSNTYPSSANREEAMFMSAYSNYKISPDYKLDQEYSQLAIDGFQTFVNTFPNSERQEEANKLIDELREKLEVKAVAGAQLYYDMKDFRSAVIAFQHVLQDFPDTKSEEDIRYKIVKSQYSLAYHSVYEKKQERAKEVLVFYDQFKKKYPNSNRLKELNNLRENTLKLLSEFTK